MKLKLILLTTICSLITPNLFAQSCEDTLNILDTYFRTQPSRTVMAKLSTENLTNSERNNLILEYVDLANTALTRYYKGFLLLQKYNSTPDSAAKNEKMLTVGRQIQILETRLTILNITSSLLKDSLGVNLKYDIEFPNTYFSQLKRPIGFLKDINNAKTVEDYAVNRATEKESNKGIFLQTPYGRDGKKHTFGFLESNTKESTLPADNISKVSFGFIPEVKVTSISKVQGFIGFIKPKETDIPYTYHPVYNPKTGKLEIQINDKSKIGFN